MTAYKRFILTVLLLIILGYLSNYMTVNKCENEVGKAIKENLEINDIKVPYYVFNKESQKIFDRLNVKYTVQQNGSIIPWMEVFSRNRYPFFIEIYYGIMHAPLAGSGGYIRYFCFFGLSFQIGGRSWVS